MNIQQILQFFDGRKAMIVAVIATTASFMAARGVIDADVATFINTIIGILAGYAEYKTPQILGSRLRR